MSEDKIQNTKEALYKFSQVAALSDIEQTILKNGANAINQLQQENTQLKETLKGTTHCYDEEEHQRLIKENEKLKKKMYSPDITDTTCPKCGEKYFINYSREVYDLKNILTEFEKWLEKGIDQKIYLNNEMLFHEFCVIAMDKLQELKGDK